MVSPFSRDLMADNAPGNFIVWLDEALSGWVLPVAALAAVALAGVLYLTGLANDDATATVVVLAVGLVAALFLLRPALDPRRDAAARALAIAAALATALATLLPALRTVRPGDPMFEGDLGRVGESIPVPSAA
ncbi:MAG: hypothetical protein ACJ79E_09460, partial [Anaeromyxobacteraceae bacterium]